jgi:diphthine-ammonia ligase
VRLIALLSGGKDSVCAVETARGWGWEVVGALVLRPAEDDAWLFHTPNLGVARGVAECLGLPVVEAEVRSGAEHELEDLERALDAARKAWNADGVVSGALASEYQRTRIDAIGHRLGLKTFAPLWHKEPAGYVRSLLRGGWDIRFSRIAAGGIPLGWAGERLDEAKLAALERNPMRPHVAGEGGEFETLVLDAPCYGARLVVGQARVESSASRSTWVVTQWTAAPRHDGGR